jgi:hypothetical protein
VTGLGLVVSKNINTGPYLPWAKIKGTYYYWDAKTGSNIRGNILGVDIELTPSVSFEFGQENNNTINASIILFVRSTQASAPKSILWLSLKALLAIEKLVNFCLLPSGSFTVSLP